MTYHLRRTDREITDQTIIDRLIRQHRYASIALCRDNQPYIVTLDYGYEPENRVLYFHCAKEGKKIDFIRANPKACATIIANHDSLNASCNRTYRSVVIDGTIELVDSREETDQAIGLMIDQLEKANPDKERAKLTSDHPFYTNLQILKLKIEEITGKARVNS